MWSDGKIIQIPDAMVVSSVVYVSVVPLLNLAVVASHYAFDLTLYSATNVRSENLKLTGGGIYV